MSTDDRENTGVMRGPVSGHSAHIKREMEKGVILEETLWWVTMYASEHDWCVHPWDTETISNLMYSTRRPLNSFFCFLCTHYLNSSVRLCHCQCVYVLFSLELKVGLKFSGKGTPPPHPKTCKATHAVTVTLQTYIPLCIITCFVSWTTTLTCLILNR